jgi:FKBP-type peptidyl-prolyl cis-trans isomerase FkpA
MLKLIVTALIALSATTAFALNTPKSEEEKTLYSVGLIVSRQLSAFNLTPAELEIVKQGLTDGVNGNKPIVELSTYNEKVQELARTRIKSQAEKLAPLNNDFLEKAAKEKGAVKTESGLIFLSLLEGSGTAPTPTDTVKVNYRGALPDGSEFDSSYKRGAPLELRLDGVITCWKEGIQKIKPGGKAKLVCPAALAYGETGVSNVILPGSPLAFEVELLEVKKRP